MSDRTAATAARVGFGPALRAALAIQAAAVLLPTVATDTGSLVVSSLVIGAAVPGIVPLVLGRVHDLVPHYLPLCSLAAACIVLALAVDLVGRVAAPRPI